MAITKQRAGRQRILDGMGRRLEMLRKRFHWAPKDMAAKVGVELKTYYRHEHGETMPNVVSLGRIQQELDVSLDWLLFNRGPETLKEKIETPEAVEAPVETIKMVEEEMPEVKELLDDMHRDQVLRHKVMLLYHDYKGKEKNKKTARKES